MEEYKDLLNIDQQVPEASLTKRFFTYLIDLIFVVVVMGFIDNFLPPYVVDGRIVPDAYFLNLLVTMCVWFVYYVTLEGSTGKSIGKLVMGTTVVREDGSPIGYKEAALRSLSRFVPFEPLSIWFSGSFGHDKWTKTRVIEKR